jgi:hypothetical protein
LGGIHIGKLVPLRSIWNRSSAIAKLHPFRIDELVEEAGLIGPAIVRGLGFTLHDCVSVFVNDLRWLVSGGADGGTITCSLATLLDAVGCPIGLDNSSGLLRPTDYRLNDAERSELVKAKMVVREFVERILRNGYFGYEGK